MLTDDHCNYTYELLAADDACGEPTDIDEHISCDEDASSRNQSHACLHAGAYNVVRSLNSV